MLLILYVPLLLAASFQTATADEIETVVANINKNGFTESLLFDVIKVDKKSSKKDLIKQLESPKVQEKLIATALKYATANVNDAAKGSIGKERSSWRDYCSYSWVRWLSFMNCKDDSSGSTAELDREEHHSFQVMKESHRCYKPSSDLDW
ncbi:uncharacterized protein LOC135836077 [Planococcus citri]|uniref:uncharacterized protein LOC135836077 n=1 Tax=Planococcus citri TaxID=170843 RepID=UPI0031F90659